MDQLARFSEDSILQLGNLPATRWRQEHSHDNFLSRSLPREWWPVIVHSYKALVRATSREHCVPSHLITCKLVLSINKEGQLTVAHRAN
jgi:hypothetical protein